MIKNRGFTLIETSIVLILISFLVGSLMIGSNLTDKARIRKAIRDLTSYQNAYIMFKEQYLGLPGDLINATSFWPGRTVNGNGNSIISCSSNGDECWRAFQQLSLAGFVPGNYNGNNQGPVLTTITPLVIQTYISTSASTRLYSYANVAAIGNWGDTVTDHAYQIDNKIDDGIPNTGIIAGTSSSNPLVSPSCVKQSDGTTDMAFTYQGANGIYNVKMPSKGCQTLLVIMN
jgi:prepilin-type N-terminal cleavage/methylation domain-containing protein